MRSRLNFLATLAITVIIFTSSDATPLVIPWNTTQSYGPDGPWPVVTVQVGSQPASTVDLYPGGIYESIILRGDFCNSNGTASDNGSSPCLAEKAGLYLLVKSKTVQQHITDAVGLIWQWSSNEAQVESGTAVNVLDTMVVSALQGTITVPESTISAVSAWRINLPDGTAYPAQVGTLSLGAPGMGTQVLGAKIGQTVPGFAYAQDTIPSNSWGMHYGSATLNQEGSLVFGGYDQSRALGDVGVYDLGGNSEMIANLLDVQIGVENGSSPFDKGVYTGLLKPINGSTSSDFVQRAVINPIIPYLFMSPETCAAVTENLPVTFNSQIGLYIWNTTDPQYETIVKSPAYLALVFQQVESGNFTIKVPFRLLNLTLEPPIVRVVQQYFPCRPFYASDDSGDCFLGKAFLQAAFIGINWQVAKFFMAQAPGPGVGASNILPMSPNDTPISTDPIEKFAVTWARHWTALSESNKIRNTTVPFTQATDGQQATSNPSNNRNSTAVPTGATSGQKGISGSGLSSSTKAGITVGVIIGALAVAGVLLLACRIRRRFSVPPQEEDVSHEQDNWVYEKDGRTRVPETGPGLAHEADNDHELHELDVGEDI